MLSSCPCALSPSEVSTGTSPSRSTEHTAPSVHGLDRAHEPEPLEIVGLGVELAGRHGPRAHAGVLERVGEPQVDLVPRPR